MNRGEDASPYTCEELRGKFMDLCGRVWPAGHCEQLLGATLGLADGAVDLADWAGLLGRAPMG